MPIFPPPSTERSSAPVELATVKSFVSGEEAVEVETANCENGEVVPMPSADVVADWPAAACVHASYANVPEPTHVLFIAKHPAVQRANGGSAHQWSTRQHDEPRLSPGR